MTKLLAQAFEKASTLPENLQDALARELMEELTWEAKWDKTLSEPMADLDDLAGKALDEYRAGRTHEKGFDQL